MANGIRQQVSASTLRMALACFPGQVPISDHQPPTEFGDNTPRIMGDWAQQSCRTWLAKNLEDQGLYIVTGGVMQSQESVVQRFTP